MIAAVDGYLDRERAKHADLGRNEYVATSVAQMSEELGISPLAVGYALSGSWEQLNALVAAGGAGRTPPVAS